MNKNKDNPENIVNYIKKEGRFLEECLEAEGDEIQVFTSRYRFLEPNYFKEIWKIIYGSDKQVYETVKNGVWEWAYCSHNNMDIGCNAKRLIERYNKIIGKGNPFVNSSELVRILAEEENQTRIKYNKAAMSDPNNDFFDSTDSNHWREG